MLDNLHSFLHQQHNYNRSLNTVAHLSNTIKFFFAFGCMCTQKSTIVATKGLVTSRCHCTPAHEMLSVF